MDQVSARREPIVYLNGELLPLSEAKVSVLDRGFLYGDGLFETIRVYRGKPFLFEAHLARLFQGAKRIKLKLGLSRRELRQAIEHLLKANQLLEAVLRLTVTRGLGEVGRLSFSLDAQPTVTIVARPFKPYPEKFYRQGVKVIVLPDQRSRLCSLKSLNFLPNLLARQEAEKKKAFEALFVDEKGYLAEGTVSNIFAVFGGKLLTPPVELGLLPGVTRALVLKLARENGIICREEKFTLSAFEKAEEVFLTNTTIEIMPVTRINQLKLGPVGDVTRFLHEKYQNAVSNKL